MTNNFYVENKASHTHPDLLLIYQKNFVFSIVHLDIFLRPYLAAFCY